jgi:hypothetical protein
MNFNHHSLAYRKIHNYVIKYTMMGMMDDLRHTVLQFLLKEVARNTSAHNMGSYYSLHHL